MQGRCVGTGVGQVRHAGSTLELSRTTGDETAAVVWDGIVCQSQVVGLMEMGS